MRLAAVLLLLVASPLQAKTAANLYAAGNFAAAAVQGPKEETLTGYIMAGRANTTMAYWQTSSKGQARTLLQRADRNFDDALALQPGHTEALMRKGISRLYRAKLDRSTGLARDARRMLDTTLKANPDNPQALGAMATWHMVVVKTFGKVAGGTLLGANTAEGEALFEKALQQPNVPITVLYTYATTILASNPDNALKARRLLHRIKTANPKDGQSRLLRANALLVLEPLDQGKFVQAQALAQRYSPLGLIP